MGRRMTCTPSSSHFARSRVESTSSNQPTLRCVCPHTEVMRTGPFSRTCLIMIGIRAVFANGSTGPPSMNRHVSPMNRSFVGRLDMFFAEQALQHLAVRVARERLHDLDVRRHLVVGQPIPHMPAHLVGGDRLAYLDDGLQHLAVTVVRYAEHRAVDDSRMGEEHLFDLAWIDV